MDTRTYNINLRNDYFNPVAVGLSQYDEGVTLAFNVYDGTDPAEFAAGTTAQIMGVRPSGVGFDVACTLTDNVATVSTITDMTGEAGIFPVEIRFYNSGVNVGTCNFIFVIEKAAHPDGTIDADITHEQDIVDKINQILVQTTPDPTLSISGRPADAKATGDAVVGLKKDLSDLQDGYYIFDLIANSYVAVDGRIVDNYPGWSRTDYIKCDGYKTMTVKYTTGAPSENNCFYDENKTFISKFSTFVNVENTIAIPTNAKYAILSNSTASMATYTLKFEPQVKEQVNRLNNAIIEKSNVTNPSTSGVTAYSQTGYIRTTDGAFVSNSGYQCYSFTMPITANVWFDAPEGWHEVAAYNGTLFDNTKLVSIRTSASGNLPTEHNPLNIAAGLIVAVCVPVNTRFVLHIGTGEYVAELPKIRVIPKYATQFYVDALDETSHKYIRYIFMHPVFTDSMTYSGGTKDVVTYDVWFNNNVNDDAGNLIFQGNTNFIHALNETGHTGHVGAGHGCTVMDCFQFFADGKPFDPATLAETIECSSFRFFIKAKHYLIDDSITQSSAHAMPVLDNNGDPVVTSEWVFDGTWYGNTIEMFNHLEIKRNNLQFRQCHAGMLCGFYPNLDNSVLSGRKGMFWNETDGTTNTNKDGSGVIFTAGQTTSIIANTVTLFSDNYIASQDINQNDPQMYGKDNILIWMPPNSDNRLKAYLMPCVCTESTALIAEGKTVDVFNVGDSIDVKMVRTIKIAP